MKYQYYLLFALLILSFDAFSQTKLNSFDKILLEGKGMMQDSITSNRIENALLFEQQLFVAIQNNDTLDFNWDSLNMVSKVSTEHYDFFSWQYFGLNEYINRTIVNYHKDTSLITQLIKSKNDFENFNEYDEYTLDDWAGGLIYNAIELNNEIGDYVLLFCFKNGDSFNNYKILDVLTQNPEGISFGAPLFYNDNDNISNGTFRHILKYNNRARIKLNFDPYWDLILYDHLVEMKSNYGQNQSTKNIPDGTYEGYRIENGYLFHVEKVFSKVLDEAPRPQPVLNSKQKDIFGNRK